jgi:hypothetical protein
MTEELKVAEIETNKPIEKGYDSLFEAVKQDCQKKENCFNLEGCNKQGNCFHKYCDKFKWIIDRAKHYSEKTGIDWKDILKGWEQQRSYWYMNFYQEANQPEIKTDKVIIVENKEDYLKKYPSKKFICPYCKGISTDPNDCNSGLKVELLNGKKKKKEVCNWKSYGLFGAMGGGVHIFLKDSCRIIEIFKPIELNTIELKNEPNKV